jgi:hypothetical protein
VSGRLLAGCLLLAIAGSLTAAGIAPAAMASPLAPSLSASAQQPASGSASGPSGKITWSVIPATSTGPDPNRVEYNYGVVTAGSSIVDHVEIVNRSTQSAAFSIYAADATGTTAQGTLLLQLPGQKPADVGAWASFPGGAGQLSTIIPGGKAIIEPFTLNVPRLATPGDHTGALVASVGVPKKNAAGVIVTQNYRIAVPIELRVPGALHAGLQVQSISTGFNDPINPFASGSASISYTVANTGNVRQSGQQLVKVTGPFGQSGFVKPPIMPTILPGDSIRVTVTIPGLFPDGPMSASVDVKPGWPRLTIPLSHAAPETTVSASLFAIPWSLLGFIVLLALLGVGVGFYFRYRARLRRAEMTAVAARARRDAERRLLGAAAANGAANGQAANGQAAANGHAVPATSPAGAGPAAEAPGQAEGAAPGGTADGTGAPEGSTTE